jgi:ribosomal protein S18 acetylase RimI-like enzyme
MPSAALDVYVKAFLARVAAAESAGDAIITEPGIHGLLPCGSEQRIRLLVTDDRALDRLSSLVGNARAGMVSVCAGAVRCRELLDDDPAWQASSATAMICRCLQAVPAAALPAGLTVRPVQRLAEDPPGGVSLEQAVATAGRADPHTTDPRALAGHLQSLPRAFRLWAAVDGDGVVRATSASAAFGATASVIFVNTDPGWRRRGIARAMAALALRAAEQAGARHAGLDASEAGRELYLRLGFEAVMPIWRYRPSA